MNNPHRPFTQYLSCQCLARVVFSISLLLCLMACGQKGDLYLPQQTTAFHSLN